MWVEMKTYNIKTEEDICKILVDNKIKQSTFIFEIVMKNVKKYNKRKNQIGQDFLIMNSSIVQSINIEKSNSSISLNRKSSADCIVIFVNVRNQNKEYLSSLVDNLNKHDRILITDGIPLKNRANSINNKLTIVARSENKSLVFMLKQQDVSLQKPISLFQNLSKITGPGTYSLFGTINKIIKFTDTDNILLRLLCFDKSSVKILKYPHNVKEFKKIVKEKMLSETEFDFSSNKVDILVENPSTDFTSLVFKQRVYLNNLKVNYFKELKLLSVHLEGKQEHLKADPIGTGITNSLRPPTKLFTIPIELRPTVLPKTKETLDDVQSNKINTYKSPKRNTIISPFKKLHQTDYSSSSSDDNVNLSPCEDFSTLKNVSSNNNRIKNTEKKKNYDICSLKKINKIKTDTNNKTFICESGLSDDDNSSVERKKCSKSRYLSSSSTDDSHSPLFFNVSQKIPEPKDQLNNLHQMNVKECTRSTQCIGPCRLVFYEPNILYNNDKSKSQDYISGYCMKCLAFFPKSSLIKLSMKYKCPNCSEIVHLTFFFKMNFLFGKNNTRAVEVCCYNENAIRIIKKLTKINITLENCLVNQDYGKSILNALNSLISNKTKINIIICESPNDNINILLAIDTKYVITSPIY